MLKQLVLDCPRSSVSYNLTYNTRIELCHAPINNALQLFPSDLVAKASVKSSCALHDETIQKVISFKNWPTQTLSKTKPQSQSSRPVSSSIKCSFYSKTNIVNTYLCI